MIRYVELTAPESSDFRQVKVLSIEVMEGDRIEVGDTLFRVQSGNSEIDLPSTKAGNISEIIVLVDENITIMTPLLLLETEVAESTASAPIIEVADNQTVNAATQTRDTNPEKPKKSKAAKVKKKSKRKKKKALRKSKNKNNSEQQSLDLYAQNSDQTESATSTNNTTNINTSNDMSNIQLTVPDIGTDSAKVIELLVKVGDSVAIEDPVITLESDKASMDVPSTHAGIVASIAVQLEQDVAEGELILELSSSEAKTTGEPELAPATTPTEQSVNSSSNADSKGNVVDVIIPDIGGDSAKVIEILVSIGQTVELETPLVTLESDKASMDVPSSVTGKVESIEVNLDQDVSSGDIVVRVLTEEDASSKSSTTHPSDSKTAPKPTTATDTSASLQKQAPSVDKTTTGKSHASPSIRRFARELGVDLTRVNGSGRKGRIKKDDVKQFVKQALSTQSGVASVAGAGIPEIPAIDFSKFGEIDIQPLNKIKRLTATNLHRSWLNVPHVTHNDESNISDLESFRKQLNGEYAKQNKGIKLSPLAFIVKAVVNALQTYPQFNSSLEPGGENLIYKKYVNIGIAVETPNGLVVPVLKEVDKKSVSEIAKEMGELAGKARDKKLTMADMSGACITISSLGGIGGTNFTPIVNAPEVAILGVSRGKMQPVWNGEEFLPGMVLPLSLSYDHRVIDGAEAARFTRHIAAVLEDVRRLTV